MRNITLAAAKANLSKLIERAAAGETVRITRCGKPVTEVKTPRNQIDHLALGALTEAMPAQKSPRGISFAVRCRYLTRNLCGYGGLCAAPKLVVAADLAPFEASPRFDILMSGVVGKHRVVARRVRTRRQLER